MHYTMKTTDGSTRGGQEVEREGKFWARVFIVVSGGKNGQGRVSRLWIGQLEFQWAPKLFGAWPWGD